MILSAPSGGRNVAKQAPVMGDLWQAYWDQVGQRWAEKPGLLWREFTDQQQLGLIEDWLPLPCRQPSARAAAATITLLKTDLFDEVAHLGLVPVLLRQGVAVVGVDVSPWVVAEALARNPGLKACQADVRSLPFADDHFDAVFSGSTLDHLNSATEIGEALVEIARVLRPGGRLILTMDNPAHPLIYLRNGRLLGLWRKLGIVPYQVGATLARGPLLEALRAAGFEILTTRALQHCPRAFAVPLAWLIRRFPLRCQRRYLGLLASCESLAELRTRWRTAHYIAVHAQVTSAPG